MEQAILEKIAGQLLTLFVGIIGAWAVMRSQVADLREKSKADSETVMALQIQVAKLESTNDGFSKKLDDAVEKLETITESLQKLAIDIARNSK